MLKNISIVLKRGYALISYQFSGVVISEAELLGQREKTNRHVRLRELLLENSRDASLVVMYVKLGFVIVILRVVFKDSNLHMSTYV